MYVPKPLKLFKFHYDFALPPHFIPDRGLCAAVCDCKTTNNFPTFKQNMQENFSVQDKYNLNH